MNPTALFMIIVSLGIIALNIYLLMFVYRLERSGCRCAETWRRQFIEFTLLFYVVIGILFVIWSDMQPSLWIKAAMLAINIAYIIITRQFINQINDTRCKCASHETAFKVLDIVNIIQIFMLVITVLIAIVAVISIASSTKAKGSRRR